MDLFLFTWDLALLVYLTGGVFLDRLKQLSVDENPVRDLNLWPTVVRSLAESIL